MKVNTPRLLTVAILLFSSSLYAQRWTQLNPPPNLFNNVIFSTAADRTGKVYAAGAFTDSAGENAVAVLNNNLWTELGTGTGQLHAKGYINALTLDPSDNLYAGGMFTDASGHYYVAQWDGSHWSETGPASSARNFTGQIFSLTADKAGNIYAAGELIDSVGDYYVSEFDGIQWQRLGTGSQSLRANGIIYSLLTDAGGNLYAAGQFTNAAGNWYVAKWNGSGWSELGTGAQALNANGAINSLAVDANGYIYAAGDFKDASGHQYVAQWDGGTWSELGVGAAALNENEMINSILVDAAGNLYAAGMGSDSTGARIVSRWSGSSWSVLTASQGLSQFNNYIFSLASDLQGNLYVAGNFTNLQGDRYVARDSANVWTQPGAVGGRMPDQANTARAMAVDTGGHVFASLGSGVYISAVVRWTGSTWVALADTSNGGFATITNLAADSLGNIYGGGTFAAAPGVARWNGSGWTIIPTTAGNLTITRVDGVRRVATDKQGNLYIAGYFQQNGYSYGFAKWNGTAWRAFGDPGDIINFIVDPVSGTLYATTVSFANAGYVIKIENNVTTDIGILSTQPTGLNANNWMEALALDAAGNLYVGGSLEDSEGNAYVAKWNGTAWSVLGKDTNTFGAQGTIKAIAFDGKGNLFAGGYLMKHSQTYIGEWNGNSWITVGDGNEFWTQLNLIFMNRDGRGNIYADVANNVYKYIGESPAPPTCGSMTALQLSVNKNTTTGQTTVDIDAKGMPTDPSTTYWIEFASDRDFTKLLAAPSEDSVLHLSAGSLTVGPNMIFAKMQAQDKCGQILVSVDSVTITKTSTGGIIDQDFPNSPIGSYPNPVADNVHVSGLSATKSYTMEIFNNQGTAVSQLVVSGQTDVNISAVSLNPGVYWLQVYDNTKNRKLGVITLLKAR